MAKKMGFQGLPDSRPATSTSPKAQQHAREGGSVGKGWGNVPDSRPKSSPSAQTKVKLGGGG